MFQKNQLKKLRLVGFFILILLISIPILALAPNVMNLAEDRIMASANLTAQNNPAVSEVVLGVDKKPVVEIKDLNDPVPQVSAKAVYILEMDLEKVLFEKNSEMRLSPASTTKIMTALVSEGQYKAADILVVPNEAMVGGSSMGLAVGENMTFRSLLYGMLLNSGNDAAFTIALNYPGGMKAFLNKMNLKVLELGLKNSHFENPAGFDSPNHFSSAADLAVIAKEAIKNPQLAKVVATKETSVISYDKTHAHNLKNLNKLLSEEEGVIGIKTGYTEKAGENLVTLIDRNGHKVLIVMLNSTDRFGETKNLIDWVYSNFQWKVN